MGVTPVDAIDARLVARERRLDALIGRWGPYAALAIGTVLTPFLPPPLPAEPRVQYWLVTGGLVLGTAGWAYVFTFRAPVVRAARPGVGALYVVGLLVLMAVLTFRSPFYAFLTLPAYAHAFEYLRGRWRYAGMWCVAVVHAYSILGGSFVELSAFFVGAVALVSALLAAAAISFTYLNAATVEQAKRRGEIIEELNEANRRLSESLDENAALHAALLAQAREAGILDERARLAREIHDTIAQGLTGIVTQLEAADAADGEAPVRRRHLDIARGLARESLTEARRSVEALAPGQLETARLPDAIADMAKKWAETAGVALSVDTTGDPRRLLPDLEVTLFRVAQEALANAGKHARATRVGLTLSYMDDVVVLDVRDDGVGFAGDRPTAERGSGFGLVAMEQRVRRVSGTFEVESAPGEGTAVSASVPAIPAEVLG